MHLYSVCSATIGERTTERRLGKANAWFMVTTISHPWIVWISHQGGETISTTSANGKKSDLLPRRVESCAISTWSWTDKELSLMKSFALTAGSSITDSRLFKFMVVSTSVSRYSLKNGWFWRIIQSIRHPYSRASTVARSVWENPGDNFSFRSFPPSGRAVVSFGSHWMTWLTYSGNQCLETTINILTRPLKRFWLILHLRKFPDTDSPEDSDVLLCSSFSEIPQRAQRLYFRIPTGLISEEQGWRYKRGGGDKISVHLPGHDDLNWSTRWVITWCI